MMGESTEADGPDNSLCPGCTGWHQSAEHELGLYYVLVVCGGDHVMAFSAQRLQDCDCILAWIGDHFP